MQTTTYPIHHGRTTEGAGRAKRPGHLFHLMTLGSPQPTAEPVNAVRPEGLLSEIEVIDGRARQQAQEIVDQAAADLDGETANLIGVFADLGSEIDALNAEQAQADAPVIVGSEAHVLELVGDGVDTLGLLVEATGLGRTTVQGRLKALVADGRLLIAQPARGGKPARYAVI